VLILAPNKTSLATHLRLERTGFATQEKINHIKMRNSLKQIPTNIRHRQRVQLLTDSTRGSSSSVLLLIFIISLQSITAAAFVNCAPIQSRICIASTIEQTCTMHLKMNLWDNLEKLMVGSLFPEDEIKVEDPKKKLASFIDLATGSPGFVSFAHNSLTAFLFEWGRALQKADGSEKLPTPVYCIPFVPQALSSKDAQMAALDEDGCTVIKTSGVKISFQKTKRYLSRTEQRGLEKGQMADRKGAKIDSWSPGGIQLLVQTVTCELSSDATNEIKEGEMGVHRLRLLARRCDIDGDTVVKVSSERTIMRRLREAIRIWNKMRSL